MSGIDVGTGDLWVSIGILVATTLILAVFLTSERELSRREGIVLLLLYAVFVIFHADQRTSGLGGLQHERELIPRAASAGIGYGCLALPLLGPLLRGRHGRLALQFLFTLVALALVVDGFTGPQSAARNLATVAPWVHLRGIVVLALLLAGNLVCMGCPFTLPRTLAKRLSAKGRRFPQRLRNKWLAIFSLFALFLAYEVLDLWASPWLTAWLIVAYFAASFALEAIFAESAFCKYVCPLGSFNMVYSSLSPTSIAVKSPDICASCVGHECVNGSYAPTPMIRLDEIAVDDGERHARRKWRMGRMERWAVAPSFSRRRCGEIWIARCAWIASVPAHTIMSACSRGRRVPN